jgi:hypothetical protein
MSKTLAPPPLSVSPIFGLLCERESFIGPVVTGKTLADNESCARAGKLRKKIKQPVINRIRTGMK